jgi:hypothetical protein
VLPIDLSLSQRRPGDSLEFPQPVQWGLRDPFVLDEHLEDLSHARFRFDQMFQSVVSIFRVVETPIHKLERRNRPSPLDLGEDELS